MRRSKVVVPQPLRPVTTVTPGSALIVTSSSTRPTREMSTRSDSTSSTPASRVERKYHGGRTGHHDGAHDHGCPGGGGQCRAVPCPVTQQPRHGSSDGRENEGHVH